MTQLSNRLHTKPVPAAEDRISSLKDDEWNRKLLEFLNDGRLEDVAQLSRNIHEQVRVKKVVNYKPMWWLSSVMGQHNRYDGSVLAYEALYGTGAAVVTLTPSEGGMGAKEYDEDDVEMVDSIIYKELMLGKVSRDAERALKVLGSEVARLLELGDRLGVLEELLKRLEPLLLRVELVEHRIALLDHLRRRQPR